jgi:RNA polymerase sigma-70 factor (ECF subfamily)
VNGVLAVVYLVYTTGHTAPSGANLMRRDLAERAYELARMLRQLLPTDPAVAGLLALILLTDARRNARLDGRELALLADQDRSVWDHSAITEGAALVRESLSKHPPHRFALMAAIAAVHDQSRSWSETDWQEILGLYDLLIETWTSPVVQLNRAIALGFAHGFEAGLAVLDDLSAEPQLARYHYLQAARADFLTRLGRNEEARLAYEEAIVLTDNEAERAFLERRLADVAG